MTSEDPVAPYKAYTYHAEPIKVDTSGKTLVVPTGDPVLLPLYNEYVGNTNRVSVAESPFGGLKGAYPPDYAVGTLSVLNSDGIYLTDKNGTNTTKTLTAGKLVELGHLTVDTSAHKITEEFRIRNDSAGTDVQVIDDCSSATGWGFAYGTGTITVESGRLKIVGTTDETGKIRVTRTGSLNLSSYYFMGFNLECTSAARIAFNLNDGTASLFWGNSDRFLIATNTNTRYVLPIRAPVGTAGQTPTSGTAQNLATIATVSIGVSNLSPATAVTFYIDDITACNGTWAQVEVAVPDKLDVNKGTVYSSYITSSYSVFTNVNQMSSPPTVSTYVSVASANLVTLDGTKLNDMYGTNYGRARYSIGTIGDVPESLGYSTPTLTYSSNSGTQKRIGFAILMPPSDGNRTLINQCQLKLETYYDDENGNKVMDLSGNGYNGTIVGGVTKLNSGGLTFDGSTGYVNCGYNPVIAISGAFTLCCKFKFNAITANSYPSIFNKGRMFGTDIVYEYGLGFNSVQNKLFFGFGNATTYTSLYTSKNNFTTGVIYTVVAKWDGSLNENGVKIYINGVLDAAKTSAVSTIQDRGFALTIGTDVTRLIDPLRFLNGVVYDAVLYNRCLTDDEAIAYCNGQPVSSEGTVVSYSPVTKNMGATTTEFSYDTSASTGLHNLVKPWIATLDNTRTDVLLDSANSNTGTMTAVTLAADNIGYPYGAMSFNGTSSYVECTDSSSLDVTTALTVCARVFITPASNPGRITILNKGDSTAYGVGFEQSTTQPLIYIVIGGTSRYLQSNTSVNTGEWVDIVWQYPNPESRIAIYINGNLDRTSSVYSGTIGVNTTNLLIGKRSTQFFSGRICDVRVYGRSLTPTEVMAYHNNQDISTTGLAASWSPYKPSSDIDFYLFDERPKALKYKSDDTGNIYDLELYPGNGNCYHGRIKYSGITRDTNSDSIPDCLDSSVLGSVAHFLKAYDYSKSWYYEFDLSTSAITTNDFSITANSLDIIPFAASEGDIIKNSSGVTLVPVETVSTATGNVSLYDVRGLSTLFMDDTPYTNHGECRVFDTVTAGNNNESTWKRVYSTDWVFTGDCVVDNGLVRLKLSSITSKLYVYTSTWTDFCIPFIYYNSVSNPVFVITSISITSDVVTINYLNSGAVTGTIIVKRGCTAVMFACSTGTIQCAVISNSRFVAGTTLYDSQYDTVGWKYTYYKNGYLSEFSPTNTHIAYFQSKTTGTTSVYNNGGYSTKAIGVFAAIGSVPFDYTLLYTDSSSMTGGDTI